MRPPNALARAWPGLIDIGEVYAWEMSIMRHSSVQPEAWEAPELFTARQNDLRTVIVLPTAGMATIRLGRHAVLVSGWYDSDRDAIISAIVALFGKPQP